MGTINTTKIMLEKEQAKIKSRKDTSEERKKLELVHKFVDTYVKPKTLCLGVSDVNLLGEIDSRCTNIVILLSRIEKDETSHHIIDDEEINFLYSKDTKIKARVGKRVADYVVRQFTYYEKINEYKEEYITPLLDKLCKENIITYDTQALDNKTKIATERITKFVNKFIVDSSKNSIEFSMFPNVFEEEYKEHFDFLFSDNMQAKKDFANILYEYIKNNIDKVDFKNIESIDFAEYTGAKLD